MFQVTVQLDGKPLRHTFVSHHPDFDDPTFAITDGDGVASFAEIKRTATLNIIVHAQNLAVRMLDGTTPSVSELSLRFRNKKNGDNLNITRRNRTFDHYDIMNRCYETYETVFRSVPPFNGSARREFPFGGGSDEIHELKRKPKIDCRYPETLAPGKLPWVQPQSVTSGVPLMHLKPPKSDAKLFGSPKRKATTVPHEFAHAVHFAMLPTLTRWLLAAQYGVWIVSELAAGNSGTHRTDKKTGALIAYVESIGIFSQRFFFFATEVRPDLRGASLRKSFVDDELSAKPALDSVLPGYVKVATRQADGTIKPHLTGSRTEGAIYGAIFLDLASRTSLADAINLYLRCGATDYSGFESYVRKQRKGKMKRDIAAVAATWKL